MNGVYFDQLFKLKSLIRCERNQPDFDNMMSLAFNKYIFGWLCICSLDEEKDATWPRVCVTAFMIVTECLAFVASVLFIYEFLETDLENCIYALFQVAALFSVVYMWTVAFILRHKIDDIFTKFQNVYDSSESKTLRTYLAEVNRKTIFITKVLVIYIFCAFPVVLTVMGASNIIYCIFKFGYIDGDQLYFPYRFVLPWNQRTLYGWIALNLLSAIAAPFYLALDYSLLAFFIGICEQHVAFFRFFAVSVKQLNGDTNSWINRTKLSGLIQFHNTTRRLFVETAEFFSLFILIQLICSAIYLACSIFLFDTFVQQFDLNIGVLIFCVFVSGSNLFLYCYYGDLSTCNSVAYADMLYESVWFQLSTEHQHFIFVMIMNAQQPLHYHGFGVARLNLVTFSRLLRNVISYYMAFKTITSK